MRVAYLTHQYFPRHVGGTEVYTHGLARRAAAEGFAVEVVTYHESPSGRPMDYGIFPEEHDGLPVREIHYNLSTAPDPARYEYANTFTAEALTRELASFSPDVVHVTHAMKLSGSALSVCHSLGIPVIVTLCDFWFICPRHTLLRWDGSVCDGPEQRLACAKCLRDTHGFLQDPVVDLPDAEMVTEIHRRARRREREPAAFWRDLNAARLRNRYLIRALLGARRIIALSAFAKRMFAKNGIPDERIEVIDHGLEVEGLRAATRRRGPIPRLVYIGSLVPHKGPHVLLEALALIPKARLECRLYGALPAQAYGERLRALAAADPRVRLMGQFPPGEMGQILAEADALVMPALWYENNPLVVKAAFYCGTPVLAARIGSLAEMVTPGKNGWLVTPGNVREWAEVIEKITAAPSTLAIEPTPVKTMDENAREMFRIYAEEAERR